MKKLIKLNDINKIITLLAFPILIVSCNSDKEIVDGLSNRILKIDSLIDSLNKNNNANNYLTININGNTRISFQAAYDLNFLNDSINIIKIDISTNKIKDENKVILFKLLDSISNNILIARLTKEEEFKKSIIGNSIKISNYEVAQYDFPIQMNWDDAKKSCTELGNGWRLPTIDELQLLYFNKNKSVEFADRNYWCSKATRYNALSLNFFTGDQENENKLYTNNVRAIRTF